MKFHFNCFLSIALALAIVGCSSENSTKSEPVSKDDTMPDQNILPLTNFITDEYNSRIGKSVSDPFVQSSGGLIPLGPDTVSYDGVFECSSICNAFETRQPGLTIKWESGSGDRIVPGQPALNDQFRIDLSGTSKGFREGNFGTLNLGDIPFTDSSSQAAPNSINSFNEQRLLSQVQAFQIVSRDNELPLFSSVDNLYEMRPSFSADLIEKIDLEQRNGGISQIRAFAQSQRKDTQRPGQSVTMIGVQPGMTYRTRVVREDASGAQTIYEKVCRIPVCPADFKIEPEQ